MRRRRQVEIIAAGGAVYALMDFIISNMTYIFLLSSWMEIQSDRFFQTPPPTPSAGYDFIIVGGGTSGAVLANKLSENHNILLLEAGGVNHHMLNNVPTLSFSNHGKVPHDWLYRTVPQAKSSFGSVNNVTFWPTGKGLGGSSLLNGMVYIRGKVKGFQEIADWTENPVWNTENVLKHYKNLEDYHGHFEHDNSGAHGRGGGMSVERGSQTPVVAKMLEAGQELGYQIRDPNVDEPIHEGFSPMDSHFKNGIRWDTYRGYLEPIMGTRKTLNVLKFAFVLKILLTGKENTAYGVRYERHGKIYEAFANKEVILCAGAIQTPRILMHSGIGPKEHLKEHKIPVKVDLPVGSKLQDRPASFLGPFFVSTGQSFLAPRDTSAANLIQYLTSGTGPFASSRIEGSYTIRSKYAKAENKSADIFTYILAQSTYQNTDRDLLSSVNKDPAVHHNYYKHGAGQDGFFQTVALTKPASYGELRLKDADPYSHPLIDPRYFHEERDLEILVDAVKIAVKLVEDTKSMKEINGKMLLIPYPGCENFLFRSDPYWRCVIQHTTITAYKYAATAPMAKDTSYPFGVVDSFLRVFNTKSLRVIDSSVLELQKVSANQCTCMMIASVAADFIEEFWKNR